MLDINEQPDPFVNADEALASVVEEEISTENPVIISNLSREVEELYQDAQRTREGDEERWLNAYQNFRGHYSKNQKYRESEKSRVFVKVTKTKVLAAYGQLVDVILSGSKFPISISETKVPEGVDEYVHLNPLKEQTGDPLTPMPDIEGQMGAIGALTEGLSTERHPLDIGFDGDGTELKPGATFEDTVSEVQLGVLEEDLSKAPLEKGPGKQQEPTIKPAHEAAVRMEKLIHDQIDESKGASVLSSAVFEAALLGTGIIKGPFNYNKTLHKWKVNAETGEREYSPSTVRVPRIEFCSIWDFYPDPNARNMEETEWVIQRHKLNKSQLRSLKDRPYFDVPKIEECIKDGPNYVYQDFEQTILSENDSVYPTSDRYEVLEYWGTLDKELVIEAGINKFETLDNMAEVQVNAWVCHGRVIRIVVNPFKPSRIPYLAFPYESNPYSFFGIGVAENMSDSQQIMNGHARMAIDNLALSGNMILDVDESALVPGQSYELYPGKVFRRQAGMPGQAIYGLKFPNTAPENLQMFDKFRQIADESTGIPSFAHGQTGVMSTTRTASGMSMLMGAASLANKTVIKNIDNYLLKPLGDAYFHWNMSFYEGELKIEGDLEVKAEGSSSFVQKEIRSQRLLTLLQTTANPAAAPFIKYPTVIKALAESLELPPEEFVNDPDTAAVYAHIIGMQNPQQSLPAPPLNDPSGTGVPAPPGEQGFSGSPQGMRQEQGAALGQ